MRTTLLRRKAVITAGGGLRLSAGDAAACESCAKGAGCALLSLRRQRPAVLPLHSSVQRRLRVQGVLQQESAAGQSVEFTVRGSWLLGAAASVYGGLALLLVAGAAFGTLLAGSADDAGALLGALGGLLVGVALLRLYDSRSGSWIWSRRVQIASADASFRDRT